MFKKLKHQQYGYLFVAPFIIGFLVFGLYPVINTIVLSFTDRTLMSSSYRFIGLQNFRQLFADSTFTTAIKNTWELWLMNFIPQIGIAFLLAIWFTNNRLKIKGVGIWRMIFYMPNLMMASAVAALFFSLFSYYGPVNQLLVRSGFLTEAVDFLRKPAVARGLVVFIQWWMWFGQTTILLMAAMTTISPSLYEAAEVDGAGTFQMFRMITLPLIKPVLIYILVTSLVGGMQMFDIPYLLTDGRGSPGNSILTNTINMYMKFHSSKGHIGAASAVGLVVFLMTSIVALLIFFLLREKHDEPAEADK
ncbi:MAG: sugar ABC transporter permease [Anaerolineaceae bacterium]|jgi:multiple sugar transport system permease protein|nr:sugar ABC transporter permease [Anaerolineaceae bacterium]